jgi:hypothetical protein
VLNSFECNPQYSLGAGAHGLGSVGNEVQDDLLQLASVAGDQWHLRGQFKLDADRRRLQIATY